MLKDDHREVERLFRRYARLGAGAKRAKRSLVRNIIKELSKHAGVEEQLLYPTLRDSVPGGAKMMKAGVDDHQTVKELLADLDGMAPDDDDFDTRVKALMEEVRGHVREEERDIFPKLRDALDRDRLVQLGRMIELAKRAAPTRPHPHMPSTPPANLLTGAVAGVVDRIRDVGREVVKGSRG